MQYQFKKLGSAMVAKFRQFVFRFMRHCEKMRMRSSVMGALLMSILLFAASHASALISQTITGLTPATPITYSTGETFTLSATGGASGNAINYASITTAVCTLSGSTVTLIAVGTCTVTANQAGNDAYSAAPQVMQSFTVATGVQAITYIYDAVGRAVQVVDSGETNSQFTYDSVGNIAAVNNATANTLSITEFTPASGAPGTSVAISGSGYDSTATNNIVTFNGAAATVTSATPTALSVVVPAGATTGPVSVANGNGSVTSVASFGLGSSLVAGNLSDAVNLVVNQSATFSFTGTTGQGLTLGFSGVSFTSVGGYFSVTVIEPSGSTLPAFSCTIRADSDCVLPYLPASGIYTINLNSTSTATVSMSLIPDVLGTLTPNTQTNFSITSVDQSATFTFAAAAGQTVQLAITADSIVGTTQIQVYAPNGSYLQSTSFVGGLNSVSSGLLVLPNLTASGTYTVRVIPPANIADGSVNIVMAPAVAGTLTVAGTATGISLSVGQIGLYTFIGTTGQSLGLGLTGIATTPTSAALAVNVTDPNGNVVATFNTSGANSGAVLPILSSTGTYTVSVNPGSTAATFNMQLSSDLTGSLAVGGAVTSFVTSTVGQGGTYTFNGTESQDLTLLLSADTLPGSTAFYVNQPSGALLSTLSVAGGSSNTLPLSNLPVTGAYTVRVRPANGATGSVVLGLQQDSTGAIAVDGSSAAANLGAGQIESFTFNGIAGQNLGLGISGLVTTPAGAPVSVTISDPSGNTIGSYSTTSTASGYALPTLVRSGIYTVMVNPGTSAASFNLMVSSDLTGSFAPGGPAANFTTANVGQNGSYTFSGVAGQDVDLLLSSNTFTGFTTVNIVQPGGQLLMTFSGNVGTSVSQLLTDLPATGTYTARLIPQNGAIGTALLSAQAEVTGLVATNSSPAAGNLATAQTGRYTFAGTAGQLLGLGLTGLVTTPANGSVTVSIFDPSGNRLGSFAANGTDTGYILPALASTGNYTVLINPGVNAVTFNLLVSSDLTGAITLNGAPTTFAPVNVGQAGSYTFSGTSGQALNLLISNDTIGGLSNYVVTQPNGATLVTASANSSGGVAAATVLELPSLPVTGTYSIRAMPTNATGSVSLSLLTLAAGGSLTVDGSQIAANVAAAQATQYTFSGTAGQNIGLGLSALSTSPANGTLTVSISDPSGRQVGSFSTTGSAANYALPTLTASGNYTILVVPGASAAAFNLQLNSDAMGTVVVDGGPIAFSASTVGQEALYTFNGIAGQDLGLLITGNTFSDATISVTQPNGQVVYPPQFNSPVIPSSTSVSWNGSGAGTSGTLELVNLPVTGTYTIQIVPQNGATGSMNLSLSSEVANTITMNGSGAVFTLAPGQIGKVTFNSAGGQNLALGLSASAANTVTVIDPFGSIVTSVSTTTQQLTNNLQALGINTVGFPISSAVQGQYTVLVYANATGGNFTLWASSGLTGALIASDAVNSNGALANQTSITTTSPGQQVIFSFTANAGQSLGLVALISPPACPDSNCLPSVSAPGGAQGMTDFTVYSPSGATLGTLVEETDIMSIALPSGYYQNGAFFSEAPQAPPIGAGGSGGGGNTGGASVLGVSMGTSGWMPLTNLTETGTYTVVTQTTVGLPGTIGGVSLVPFATATATVDGGATVSNLVYGQGAIYTFTGTVGQNLEIAISSQAPQSSGVFAHTVTITDPNGGLVGTFAGPASINDLVEYAYSLPTLSVSGTYTVVVTPSAGETQSIWVSSDASLTLGGTPTSQPVAYTGKTTYLFSGTAGQTVSLEFTGNTYNGSTSFIAIQPNGSVLNYTTLTYAGVGAGTSGSLILTNLPVTGTYKLVVSPQSGASGNVAVALESELAGAATPNGSTPMNLQAGQEGIYTFSGTVGQIVDIAMTGATTTPGGGTITMTVTNPDGSNLTSFSAYDGRSAVNLPAALKQAGTYTMTITSSGPNGPVAAKLNVVMSTDVTAALTLDGPSVPVTLSLSGQAATYTFNGTAGQTVTLLGTGDTIPTYFVMYVYAPNGTLISADHYVFYGGSGAPGTGSLVLSNLPATGVYTVRGIPQDGWGNDTGATGSISLALQSEVSGTVALNGSTAVKLETAQQGTYTFTGTVGQVIDLAMTGVTTTPSGGTVTMAIANPDGSNLTSFSAYDGGSAVNLPAALTQAGAYTMTITSSGPNGPVAANLNVVLSTDVTAALTLDGPSVPVTLSLSGQAATYTFNGTAGQTVSLLGTGDTIPGYTDMYVYAPNGTLISAYHYVFYGGSGTPGTGSLLLADLPATGVYTVRCIPQDGNGNNTGATGRVSMALEASASGTVPVNGTLAVNLAAGQEGIYTFSGTAGQNIGLAMTGVTTTPSGGTATITILNPDDSTFATLSAGDGGMNNSLPPTLSQTGTYTVLINAGVDAVSLNFWVSTYVTAPLNVNDTAVPVTLTQVGQPALYTFSGTAGQTVSLLINGDTIPGTTTFFVGDPNGNYVNKVTATYSGNGPGATATLDLTNLALTGTYTVQVTPLNGATGSVSLALEFGTPNNVGASTQTISFAPLTARMTGSVPFTLTASASSGLAVTFSSSTTTVCTVSGDTVTLVGIGGTCVVNANQSGNSAYYAAPQVTQSFAVAVNPISINLASSPTGQVLSVPATVTLTATATDSSGTITQVAFYNSSSLLGTVAQAPYTFNWSNIAPGSYTVTAQSTDSLGVVGTSNPLSVTVMAPQQIGNWVSQTLPSTQSWGPVTYGGGTFVTVGFDSTAAAYSINGGTTWNQSTLPTYASWLPIAYGNGVFVAIALNNNIVATSPDGITWTQHTMPASAAWNSVTYGNSVFVAVAKNGTVATSADGANWAAGTLPTGATWQAVGFGNGQFVAVSWGGNSAATSPDGVNWTSRTLPASAQWVSVGYGDGVFVALTYGSNIVATSVDGITWTQSAMPESAQWCRVAFGDGLFVAVAGDSIVGTIAATSIDGVNWANNSLPIASNWTGVAFGNNEFVAVAGGNLTYNAAALPVTSNIPPPTVAITSPTASQTWNAPATIPLTAAAASSFGSITQVQFFSGSTLLGTATQSPYTFNWSNVAAGTYDITAVATDNTGATVSSTPVTVTVGAQLSIRLTTPNASQAWGALMTIPSAATISCRSAITETSADGITRIKSNVPVAGNWTELACADNAFVAVAGGNLTEKATTLSITSNFVRSGNTRQSTRYSVSS